VQSGTEEAVTGGASGGEATTSVLAPRTDRQLPGVALYFALTYALMLLFGGLAVLASRGAVTLPVPPVGLLAIGGMGPLVAAVIAAAYEGGGGAVRALLARVGHWRVPVIWYAVAILGPALLVALAFLLGLAFGDPLPAAPPAGVWSTLPLLAVVYFVIAVVEETGWRGYAQPRLQRPYGALGAGLIVGILWALWHLPQWWIPATGQAEKWPFFIFAAGTVAQSVLLAWLLNRAGGSVLLVALAHAAINLAPEPWAAAWRDLPADDRGPYPSILIAAVWVVAAVFLVAVTEPRGLTRRRATSGRSAGEG
jgi:membrane protease YdiL (CAAX protease family)